MNIGIIGYGFVGKAIECGFRDKCKIFVSDPAYPMIHLPIKEIAKNCQWIFICVPTPVKENGEFQSGIIDSVMDELMPELERVNIDKPERAKHRVVIKSAVIPTWVKKANNKYKQNFIVSPEYLSEKDANRQFVNMPFMLMGGGHWVGYELKDTFSDNSICGIKDYAVLQNADDAALLKYMENSFLAMKVIFINEFYSLWCKLKGVDEYATALDKSWGHLMEKFHLDKRMGTSHYNVPGPDGDKGFGGKCLPKDILAITKEADDLGVSLDIMKTVWEKNLKIRKNRDWEKIDGAII